MRLHRLEIEGFGPFRERQIVDFDAFAEDGIFLIAGRTGAGKSSILDAVCFGLYGGVPRYEGGEKRLRSDHCEPDDLSEVVVEFSTGAGRFRVARSPEYLRPAKRGGGLTKQAAAVALEERIGDAWIGRAARAVDAANELKDILQLSQEQFLQVILLAQNRFARFLLADSRDRQALLRRLFGTERFEDVQARFDERRKASENAIGMRMATLGAKLSEAERVAAAALSVQATDAGTDADGAAEPAVLAFGGATTTERIDALGQALARAGYRAERAAADRDEAEQTATDADSALVSVREAQKAQRERDRARAALAALDERGPSIQAARAELDRARSAEVLRSLLAAVDRASAAGAAAEAAAEAARRRWLDLGVEGGGSGAGELEAWAEEATRQSGAWRGVLEDERGAAGLDAEVETARRRVAEASERIDADENERAAMPERRRELAAEREAVVRRADRRSALAAELTRATARAAAAEDAERLGEALRAAERELLAASEGLAEAQTALTAQRRRRLEGYAGELADALSEQEPCPVCGSREHPAPAKHADPVSAEDVECAEAVRDAAAKAERAARDAEATLRAESAAAAAIAEGRSPAAAEEERLAAAAAVDDAEAAVTELVALDAGLAELDARAQELDAARTASLDALAATREELGALEQRAREGRARIEAARGSFGTVAERLEHVDLRIAAARDLIAAHAESSRRAAALDEAVREQVTALEVSDFVDAAEVRRALRSEDERATLEARVTSHAVQREKEREILFELELRTLPEEPIELDEAERASATARQAWRSAVDVAVRASGAVEQLAGLIEDATREHEGSAAQAAEHEVLRGLADTLSGRGENTRKMTLETFVLAAELEEIVSAANRRLLQMQDGRYQLRHSDALAARGAASGLGIVVHDAFTGQTRPAQSLSGGETFLCSLALALGLAEVVTARAGGIQLDTLFIDEGFGSLDADTLDVAMRTLDELRAGGRTVGVISHVEAMQEQIPAQLRVEQTEAGPSRILAR
ncbi:AAA family ATPase [Microbacterium sp. NPDC055903]